MVTDARSYATTSRVIADARFLHLSFALGLFAFVLFVSLSELLRSQTVPQTLIKGRVLDDSTRSPLPLANVFIANSTLGTCTDTLGRFALTGIPIGRQEIVASMVGYQAMSTTMLLSDSAIPQLEFRLRPKVIRLPMVIVEGRNPVEWKKRLQRFTDDFLGSTSNATLCRILNPEVLDFSIDPKTGCFTATALAPLQVENDALGYRCQYYLQLFKEMRESWPYTSYQYLGVAKFEEMRPHDESEAKQWRKGRERAYYGSIQHFFSSLIRKKLKQDGFRVSRIRTRWIQTALQLPVGFDMDADELLTPGAVQYQRRLSFDEPLQIAYTAYHERRYSVIELAQPSVNIYTNGYPEDPLSILIYGYWAYQRFADALPIDYQANE